MATLQLQLQSAAPVLLAGRSSMIYPSLKVIRSVPAGRMRVSRPTFGSRVPQRSIRAEAAVTEAATEKLPTPVAEVVKRLQGKVYVAGGAALHTVHPCCADGAATLQGSDLCLTAQASPASWRRVSSRSSCMPEFPSSQVLSGVCAAANSHCRAPHHQWSSQVADSPPFHGMKTTPKPQFVTGVPEDDPAAEALDFALQFELIKKQEASKLQLREVDFADPDSYGIPRWGTA